MTMVIASFLTLFTKAIHFLFLYVNKLIQQV